MTIDPTAQTRLQPQSEWTDDGPDSDFVTRAAHYLRDQGLDPQAIVLALRTELELPASEAIRLAGGELSPTPTGGALEPIGPVVTDSRNRIHPGGVLALSPRSD